MTLATSTRLFAGAALAAVLAVALPAAPASAQSVSFEGNTFTNDGLVGVARLPSNARDAYGDTLGGWGSAISRPRLRGRARPGIEAGKRRRTCRYVS